MPARGARVAEGRDIAPQCRIENADLVTPAGDHGRRWPAKLLAKEANRLVERVATTLVIELGPKHAKQCVAPVKPVRANGEIHEQRQALRLRENRPKLSAAAIMQLDGAEYSKPNHSSPPHPSPSVPASAFGI